MLNPPLNDWQGRTAWIVGASSGIGAAIAHELHARGARVAVSARNAARLAQFTATHAGAIALPCDATEPRAVRHCADELARGGPVDLVVYCAGHYKATSAHAFDLEEMLRHQQVNYVGALNLLAAAVPVLLQQGHGHLSLMASVAGYRGLPRSLAYGPTKAALINLSQTLYMELRAAGIGVSVVNPGFVATPLTAQNEFRMPALISPEEAARATLRGWARGEFEIHYPKRFTLAMKALALLPFAAYQFLVRRAVRP